jgi:ATP-dependent DNA helicase RecQ
VIVNTLKEAIKRYWGYDQFRPLQREAMEAACTGRDSVVVLPTGGGKSLCYQVPAVTLPGLTVVVSPLISLMKDQVDDLKECGVAAARIDSSLTAGERRQVEAAILHGKLKLLYVAPERLVTETFIGLLRRVELSLLAIDEAHCISLWGHDFRPEYRQLGTLRDLFPKAAIGAYTATATEPVRRDIAEQLHLKDPQVLVGSFDRPNLVYKVRPRNNLLRQVREVLEGHRGESGIIYCIRRADVDQMCASLTAKGYRAAPYHAGLSDEDRRQNQEAFVQDKVQTIVATIAFGMGIDKSNVRYVIHAGMPKSLEHYQQESGRAGRDGLEAECCLFYGGGDYSTWKGLLGDMEPQAREIALTKLSRMYHHCTSGLCRHAAILEYFGQSLGKTECGACDVCLGEIDTIPDGQVTSQKILSCILRVNERFGAGYVAQVLTGSREARVLENGHDRLSTYGLLKDCDRGVVLDWIEQLIGQGHVAKTGDFNVLAVTATGWEVVRGKLTPRLMKPVVRAQKKEKKVASAVKGDSWEGVDHGLFEALRSVRSGLAQKKGLPAYVIFTDAALRDMARRKPSTPEDFLQVKGVGEVKCRQYASVMLEAIRKYLATHS